MHYNGKSYTFQAGIQLQLHTSMNNDNKLNLPEIVIDVP